MTTTLDTSRADVPLPRLIAVELRKSVDTLAGRWMLILVLIATALADLVAIFVFKAGLHHPIALSHFMYAQNKVSFFIAVLAALMATSEWSQRTGVTTFVLVPARWKTVVAKSLAAVILGTAAFAFSVLLGALLAAPSGGWDLSAVELFNRWVSQLIAVLQGLAFGFLLLNSAGALVMYFSVLVLSKLASPAVLAWAALGGHETAQSVQRWIDLNVASAVLYHSKHWLTGAQWGHLLVSFMVFAGIWLAIGVWRVLTAAVK
jgi:hypothetical protein